MIRAWRKWRLRCAIKAFSHKFAFGQYPCATCGHWRVLHRDDNAKCMIGFHHNGQNFPCQCIKYVPPQILADDFNKIICLAAKAS